MFDLEQELRKFLESLGNKKLISRDCLDEVESHILDEVDDLVAHGYNVEIAFQKATATFGISTDLLVEYSKLYEDSRYSKFKNVMSHYFDKRSVMKVLIGFTLGALFMLAGLALEGGHVSSLIQFTSFFMVSGMALGMSLLNFSPQKIYYAYCDVLRGKQADSHLFKVIGRNFLNAGLFGGLCGLVHVVGNVDTPSEIGPALAVSLMSLLYGFLGYLFFGLGFEATSIKVASDKSEFRPIIKKSLFPLALIVIAIMGSFGFGLGFNFLHQIFYFTSILIVMAGVLLVFAFVPKLQKVHLPYLANGALASGFIGCLFGTIHVMENLGRPDAIFAGLSVSLTPFVLAIFVSTVFRSMSENSEPDSHSEFSSPKLQTLVPYYIGAIAMLVVPTSLVIFSLNLHKLVQ